MNTQYFKLNKNILDKMNNKKYLIDFSILTSKESSKNSYFDNFESVNQQSNLFKKNLSTISKNSDIGI